MTRNVLSCQSIFLLIQLTLVNLTFSDLVVNIKNQGGEVFQEKFVSNVTEETVQLDLEQTDGSIITQFIDFKNDIQILNVIVLGEEEQKESQYQVNCFVTHFKKSDFIPPDAMAKLRQKNPWTVRIPEKDYGKENVTLDILLDISSTDWISPHIKTICSDAKDSTYARREELESILSIKSSLKNLDNIHNTEKNEIEGQPDAAVGAGLSNDFEAHEMFLRTVKGTSNIQDECFPPSSTTLMKESMITLSKNKPCICDLELCIGWYPSALKYCKGKDPGGQSSSYRCGIHTAKICRRYIYTVLRRSSCLASF